MNALLPSLMPPAVVAVEAFADAPETLLFPEEEAYLARSVPKRRREFATARVCARAALAGIGVAAGPILPGLRGAPNWPAGVTGSMTHCDGYRAGAVASSLDVLALGIDAEPGRPLPDGVLKHVALPDEKTMVEHLGVVAPHVCWDRLLFSVKEAVFKTWFPLTMANLDFHEARISFDWPSDTFTASLLVPGPVIAGDAVQGFNGRWLSRRGLLVTAVVLTPVAALR